MARYKLTIAYDGSGFHGWQRQNPPGQEPLRTVQGVFDQILPRLLGQPIDLVGASRTDTGVHAFGQVAHFDAETPIPTNRLADAINSRLPSDVEVRAAEAVPDEFHAIRGAVTKQYRYRIWNVTERPLGLRHLVFHGWVELNLNAMADAAARFAGEHDFAGFANAGHGRDNTVRTVHRCEVHRDGPELIVTVEGSGFLYNMVRIMVGTLFEIGRGKFQPGLIDEVLSHGNRRAAGPTMPPQGLCLHWIQHQTPLQTP